MTDLSTIIERLTELQEGLRVDGERYASDASGLRACVSLRYGAQDLGGIIRDLEALRDWPEDHGHYIGVPVADDPDRQE